MSSVLNLLDQIKVFLGVRGLWKLFPSHRIKCLLQFEATEDNSAWQLLWACNQLNNPEQKAELFSQFLEEAHHAELFRAYIRLKKPFKPHLKYEIDVIKVWTQKQLERCRMDDIQGVFRRAELLTTLVDHYFYVRHKRFLGPKEGFAWIESNDPKTYKLIDHALRHPTNLSFLKAAATSVYRISLN